MGNLAPIPDGVDAVTASLTEPLAVALRGVSDKARVWTDSAVLVLGAGPIGLCARSPRGTSREVAITARHPHQRAAAETLGVSVVDEAELEAWAKDIGPTS